MSPTEEPPKSCRDIFYRHVLASACPFKDQIVLAEKVYKYFEHSAYDNLLDFERDLADLCALTVIFSESPGSIAEFGSFSVIKELKERILVILHKDDTYKESFIWRGPALYLQNFAKNNGGQDPVLIYEWKRDYEPGELPSSDDFLESMDLQETIESIIAQSPKSKKFELGRSGDIMLLILDLLQYVILAKMEEIYHFLNALGVGLKQQKVEQLISLLVSLGFVVRKPYRNYVFYLPYDNQPWLKIAYDRTATNKDVLRWRDKFQDYYEKNEKDKNRAFKAHMRSLCKSGDTS